MFRSAQHDRNSKFSSLHSHEIEEELAPKIKHPAPGIFYFAVGHLGEHAGGDVVRDLIAQIVLDLQLNALFVERSDDICLHRVVA